VGQNGWSKGPLIREGPEGFGEGWEGGGTNRYGKIQRRLAWHDRHRLMCKGRALPSRQHLEAKEGKEAKEAKEATENNANLLRPDF